MITIFYQKVPSDLNLRGVLAGKKVLLSKIQTVIIISLPQNLMLLKLHGIFETLHFFSPLNCLLSFSTTLKSNCLIRQYELGAIPNSPCKHNSLEIILKRYFILDPFKGTHKTLYM